MFVFICITILHVCNDVIENLNQQLFGQNFYTMLINQFLKVSASFGLIYQCGTCPKFRKYLYIFIAAAMMVGKKKCPPAHFPI